MTRRQSRVPGPGPASGLGLSLLGFAAALIPIGLVVLLVMKTIPFYYEHQRIREILQALESSGQTADSTDLDLRRSFDRRAQIDDIQSVKASDLVIEKVGNNKVVRVDYAAKIPLVEHISLLIDFSASSSASGGKP